MGTGRKKRESLSMLSTNAVCLFFKIGSVKGWLNPLIWRGDLSDSLSSQSRWLCCLRFQSSLPNSSLMIARPGQTQLIGPEAEERKEGQSLCSPHYQVGIWQPDLPSPLQWASPAPPPHPTTTTRELESVGTTSIWLEVAGPSPWATPCCLA